MSNAYKNVYTRMYNAYKILSIKLNNHALSKQSYNTDQNIVLKHILHIKTWHKVQKPCFPFVSISQQRLSPQKKLDKSSN